jgi:hypothetical protein
VLRFIYELHVVYNYETWLLKSGDGWYTAGRHFLSLGRSSKYIRVSQTLRSVGLPLTLYV